MSITMDRDDITALVELPKSMTAIDVFATPRTDGKPHPIDGILARIRSEIDAFKPDMTTSGGRKRIASMARRVASAKGALEEVGEALAREQKEIPKRIDATRRHIKVTLDQWRDEVRQPLTDWEAAEEKRIADIKAVLAILDADKIAKPDETVAQLRQRLDAVRAMDITDAAFAEYLEAARELVHQSITALTHRLAAAQKRDAEAAELAKLRAEKAERDRIEREADDRAAQAEREKRIAEMAAAKAKADAEAAARAAQDAAEARERQLKADVAAAEQRAVDAAKRAKDEAEALARAADVERAKREADKNHRAAVNRAALRAFASHGIAEAVAKDVIKLIATGAIPAIAIHY